jgi:hypothetical protein
MMCTMSDICKEYMMNKFSVMIRGCFSLRK